MNSSSGSNTSLSDIGIIFVSPIIGLTDSMVATFGYFEDIGIPVIGIDTLVDQGKKTFWKVISLTMLPGALSRCIAFANSFPEHKTFDKINDAISQLIHEGKKRIVLGGMSGGFIFAARIVQDPCDEEIREHKVRKMKPYVAGLFGISPFIFFPHGVYRKDVRLDFISKDTTTLLLFGSRDDIIPRGTIEYAEVASRAHPHIKVRIFKNDEFGSNSKEVRHQFFGGKDFIEPLKNIFWHPQAEAAALDAMKDFLHTLV